ncbi:MAG: hypothetical protein EP298_09265 [Gammaproteobacteria bacterium]|nr:MAG: hypothetical protein EP298_09265 [Gammaproteobacteria bacterium]UTW42331.1 hypothetical protein KFE69_12720 [bacterium SCSIO 12844]
MKWKHNYIINLITILAFMVLSTAYADTSTTGASTTSSAALTSAADSPQSKDYFFTKDYQKVATLPAFSLGAPVGLVPSWGVIFAGAGGLTNSPSSNDVDGSLAFGFGIGDAIKNVGGAISLGIGSVDPTDGGEFNRGNFGVSLGHFFTKTLTAISVGGLNLGGWNDGGSDAMDPSFYGAITQILPNDYFPVILNLGVGNNSFYYLKSDQRPTTHVGVFGSAAVYILPQLSAIVDYTSGVTTAGVGIVPIAAWPISITLSVYDIFEYVPDHPRVSFMGSISYAYTF